MSRGGSLGRPQEWSGRHRVKEMPSISFYMATLVPLFLAAVNLPFGFNVPIYHHPVAIPVNHATGCGY